MGAAVLVALNSRGCVVEGPAASYDVELAKSFKEAAEAAGILVGAAVNPAWLRDEALYLDVATEQFSSFTPENVMKMAATQPERGEFDFSEGDSLVEFAEGVGAVVHGHALVWHLALPSWIEEFEGNETEWRSLLETHVKTVAGHFRGKVASWDVVNEAFTDTGYRDTIWFRHLGPGYVADAFRWAREADPDADLYYNDFGLSGDPGKLNHVLDELEAMVDEGVPIDGLGVQAHVELNSPSNATLDACVGILKERLGQLGLKLRVSELDVSLNRDGRYCNFTDDLAAQQEHRFRSLAAKFLSVPQLTGVTFWGFSDAHTWIPHYFHDPDWPLPFDASYRPKPAARGFLDALLAAGGS